MPRIPRWEKPKINAEYTEDAEFTEKNGKSRFLHCAPAEKSRRSGRDDKSQAGSWGRVKGSWPG
jgi:hypothetical protein